jgi:hypothetical protein
MRHTTLTLAAALLATTIGAASAQTAQDHAAHHPDAASAASDTGASPHKGCGTGDLAALGKVGGETPMSGGMGPMMPMMGGGMMGGGMAMAPFAHIEGRIAFIKAELAITDAQAPQWSAFADTLRERAKTMRDSMSDMMKSDQPANAADRADAMVKMMSAHLEVMKTYAAAEKALYAVLTGAQKTTADELLGGSMMGGGGPMMGMGGKAM